jgi:Putative glycolipid-binding
MTHARAARVYFHRKPLVGDVSNAAFARGLCDTGPVPFAPFPATACWRHRGARSGFEAAFFQARPGRWRIDGTTAAVEDGQPWVVTYAIELDAAWLTRQARVTPRTAAGLRETVLAADGEGRWRDAPLSGRTGLVRARTIIAGHNTRHGQRPTMRSQRHVCGPGVPGKM